MPIPPYGFQDNNPASPASSAAMEAFLQYIAGYALNPLSPTSVQTSAYTAAAQDLVKCDTSGGAFAVSLPSAPVDKTVVGVQLVAGTAPVTVQAQGSDQIDVQGGVGAMTLSQPDETVWLQYQNSTSKWSALSHALLVTVLDNLTDVLIQTAQDGQALVYSAATSQWRNQVLPLLTATGPGGTVGGTAGSTVSLPNPGGSNGYGLFWMAVPSGGTTVTMPAPAVIGSRLILRATQATSGGTLTFAASPQVMFPGAGGPLTGALGVGGQFVGFSTQANADNWIEFVCARDSSSVPTWYGFPVTLGVVNTLLETCKAAATSPIANTTTGTLPVINGYQVLENDRVLLTAQSTGPRNGVRIAHASQAWGRAPDCPSGGLITAAIVPVDTTDQSYPASLWYLGSSAPITVDTTAQTWVQASGAPLATSGVPLASSPTGALGTSPYGARADHQHPQSQFSPTDGSAPLLSWNFDPAVESGQSTVTSGQPHCLRIHWPYASQSLTNVLIGVSALASTSTANQNFVGVYYFNGTSWVQGAASSAGTLDTMLTAQIALKTVPLSAPWTPSGAQDLYVVLLANVTGTLKLASTSAGASSAGTLLMANAGWTNTAPRFGQTSASGLTALPAPLGTMTISTASQAFWVGLS